MKTQLGLYKIMENGGTTPKISINETVLSKIQKEISESRLRKELNILNSRNQGFQDEEYNYKLCFNDTFPDKLFVISEVRTFDNNKFISHKFKIKCFDTDGNSIDFYEKECVGFYENCYILKEDL